MLHACMSGGGVTNPLRCYLVTEYMYVLSCTSILHVHCTCLRIKDNRVEKFSFSKCTLKYFISNVTFFTCWSLHFFILNLHISFAHGYKYPRNITVLKWNLTVITETVSLLILNK